MAKAKSKIKNKVRSKAVKAASIKTKTKRAAHKRYKVTATGLIKASKAGKQHNAGSKNRSRKNRLKKLKIVRSEKRRLIARCLPNSL
jgi:large subunit ribosomal protein L35